VKADAPPRHVALFTGSLPEGAIQRIWINLANEFAEHGHRIDLVAARFEGEPPGDLHPGVRAIDLDALATRTPWFRARRRRWLPASAPELAGYLRRERPEGLLCGGNYANLAGIVARRLSKHDLRVTISEHNPISRAVSHSGRVRLLLPRLVRHFYPEADAIVAVSGAIADDLASFAKLPRERITAIPNPVWTPWLKARIAEAPPHPEWLAGDGALVVTAARLAPQKDLGTLLRAFALLCQRRPARLLILGKGRSRAALEALIRELAIEDHVILPGHVPNPLPYFRAADVFALSSTYEGFGNVLVEALASGCPVVSTDCLGGPREILGQGRFGRLVPPGDAPALAEALEKTLDSPRDREALASRAADFSVARIADAYWSLPLA
jgi:glycosyltransferase involved in cell wall biosynthesis